jgi:endonuclease/exonuclease/phosphatase family metal-dependent hydrolase
VLVRTWNLFHGNTVPRSRDNYLEEMVRLAVSDAPAVLCLQELPLWALPELEGWSGMTAFTQVAHRTPLGASLGRTVTEVHPGLLRSAVSGQGNAILLDRSLEPFDYHALVLNPRGFRSRERGLELGTRLAWAKERRALQVVRAALPDGQNVLVANLHATHYPADRRLAEAEVRRGAEFFLALAQPGEIDVFAGDFNLTGEQLGALVEEGFSDPGPGVDHVLVRGAAVSPPERWPDDRRRLHGRLVSDHAPLEVRVG